MRRCIFDISRLDPCILLYFLIFSTASAIFCHSKTLNNGSGPSHEYGGGPGHGVVGPVGGSNGTIEVVESHYCY